MGIYGYFFSGANRNTVKKTLVSLVQAKTIAKHGVGKGSWYSKV